MTSTHSTSTSRFVFFVLGLGLSIFGVLHSITGYPGPTVFVRFARELPTLEAVASFGMGIAAVLLGLALLVPCLLRLRCRRQPPPLYLISNGQYAGRPLSAGRRVPVRDDDLELDGFVDDAIQGTGSDYGGAFGGGYPTGQQGNGEYDQRGQAGSYR